MKDLPTQTPRGGGAIIAIAIIGGAIIGLAMRQPSIGVLAGTALGVAAAIGLWLRDRRRPR